MTKIDLQRVLDLDAHATAGPWRTDSTECEVGIIWGAPRQLGGGESGVHPMVTDFVVEYEDAALIATYRTAAPAMAKALQEVIAFHVETGGKECLTCTDERGPKPYPCPTVKAIVKHLGGLE